MKKIKILGAVFFAAVIGTVIYAFSLKKNEVPQKVTAAFAKKFPTVKKVKWERESDTEWEGEFKIKGTEYSANFLEYATWQETEHEIKRSAIPVNVKTTLNTEFSGFKIEEAEISETPAGSVYEFELEKGVIEMEVVIDANGEVVDKKMKIDEEDKD